MVVTHPEIILPSHLTCHGVEHVLEFFGTFDNQRKKAMHLFSRNFYQECPNTTMELPEIYKKTFC